jgi:lipopolysaccharide/colanic/teichoic acid biosynthesis glycosyltransferase
MITRIVLFIADIFLLNAAFLLAFLVRYGLPFPERNFASYKSSFVFLTLIYMFILFFFGVYKKRFKSSWDLFTRIFCGLFLGTLLSISFVYAFRTKWGAFPTSIFIFPFFISLFLIFKTNQLVLKHKGGIRKKVVVIGGANKKDMVIAKADIVSNRIDDIERLIKQGDLDEIVICEKIQDEKLFNPLIFLIQRSRIDVVFSPAIYMKMLPEKINGNNSVNFLSTFTGRKRDVEEFLIRTLDLIGSIMILFISTPIMVLISFIIRISSPGPVLYKQKRVGKDGETFTLFKFRTMVKDAEKTVGPVLADKGDSRVTGVGRFLRATRLDELPQLFNVLRGEMSLVGPRPERPHFVKLHKALRELRLTVKPGITGLAQIRSFYDLIPRHKIKYDYLYIQQRSLLLNLYILAKTIPVVFSKKGW